MGGEREHGKDLQGAAVQPKQQAADTSSQAMINPAWMPAPAPDGQRQPMIEPSWMTPQQRAASSGPPQALIQPAWAPQAGAAAPPSQPLGQLDPGLVALAKAALGADLSGVQVRVMPQLQAQGKLGMAQGGELIGLSPSVTSNPRPTLAHELIHIAQHPRSGVPHAKPSQGAPCLDVEHEAHAGAPKILAGQAVQVINTIGDQPYFQEADDQHAPDETNDFKSAKGLKGDFARKKYENETSEISIVRKEEFETHVETMIQSAISAIQASFSSFPAFDYQFSENTSNNYATFNHFEWRMKVYQDNFFSDGDLIPQKSLRDLKKTIFHEARHAEQAYRSLLLVFKTSNATYEDLKSFNIVDSAGSKTSYSDILLKSISSESKDLAYKDSEAERWVSHYCPFTDQGSDYRAFLDNKRNIYQIESELHLAQIQLDQIRAEMSVAKKTDATLYHSLLTKHTHIKQGIDLKKKELDKMNEKDKEFSTEKDAYEVDSRLDVSP